MKSQPAYWLADGTVTVPIQEWKDCFPLLSCLLRGLIPVTRDSSSWLAAQTGVSPKVLV